MSAQELAALLLFARVMAFALGPNTTLSAAHAADAPWALRTTPVLP